MLRAAFGSLAPASLGRPVSAASLGVFRIVFGLVVAYSALRTLALGWVSPQYLAPDMRFPYAGFAWLPLGPPSLVYGRYVLLALCGGLLALGWRSRCAAALISGLVAWNHLLDKALYLNHHHLMMLLAGLLVFLPSDRAYALRRGRGDGQVARGALWLLRAQVGLVYVHAGLAKLHSDWLFRAEPLRLWLGERDHWPLIGPWLADPGTATLAAWTGLFFDLTVPFALLWRRTRVAAMAAVVIFHAATAALFPIGVFPWLMIPAATLFLSPEWPRRFHRGFGLGSKVEGAVPPRVVARPAWGLMMAGLLWIVIQALWPLRTHLVEGDPLWHERGFRFSWRVMLMEKQGSAEFRVVERGPEGRRRRARPAEYLTPIQVRMMATQPDMILDFARHLARESQDDGWRDVQVFVDSWVTLNGDPAAALIAPDVDLAAITPGLCDRDWITRRPSGRVPAED